MIVDIIGSRFDISTEAHLLMRILFAKVREFMEHNEYFHEEHFLEFLEEDDNFELVDTTSPAAAVILTAQLEDWVAEAAMDDDEVDPDHVSSEEEDADPEDDEPYEEDDDE